MAGVQSISESAKALSFFVRIENHFLLPHSSDFSSCKAKFTVL